MLSSGTNPRGCRLSCMTKGGEKHMVKKVALAVLAFALMVSWGVLPAMAYNCPVQIKQAEELLKKAEGQAKTPETKALLTEAKKLLGEAKKSHGEAKAKMDHADAVRKAKTPQALAEEIAAIAGQQQSRP